MNIWLRLLSLKTCCSVTKQCLTPCNSCTAARLAPLSCTVSWSLLKFVSTESVMLCNYLILCHPLLFCRQSFPASGGPFPMSQLFESGGQSIGTSASASVLPMNVQGWFPLELTGFIFLLSRRLSWVFSSTTVWKHQFFGASLLYGPTLTSICDC